MTEEYFEDASDVLKTSDIESSTTDKRKKSIFVTPNLRKYYGVESITEYSDQKSKLFVTIYKIHNKIVEFPYLCTENMLNGYENPYEGFAEKGHVCGMTEGFSNVLWEQLEPHVHDHVAANDNPLAFDEVQRVEFLRDNPEYRNEVIPPPPDEEFQIVGQPPAPNERSIMTEPDETFQTVPEFLSNLSGTGIKAMVKKIYPRYKTLERVWGYCAYCFQYFDRKIFYPPIKYDDVYKHVSQYENCIYCDRPNYLKMGEDPIPVLAFDIEVIHPEVPRQTLRVCGVRYFVVQEKDFVKIKGKLEYEGTELRFRCYSIEVIRLQKSKVSQVGEHDVPKESDTHDKARGVAIKICKEKYLRDGTAIPMDDLINELCNGRPDIRSILVMDNGELDLHLSKNSRLKAFLASLLVPEPEDDGKIEKIGSRHLSYLWKPNRSGSTIDITSKGLPK